MMSLAMKALLTSSQFHTRARGYTHTFTAHLAVPQCCSTSYLYNIPLSWRCRLRMFSFQSTSFERLHINKSTARSYHSNAGLGLDVNVESFCFRFRIMTCSASIIYTVCTQNLRVVALILLTMQSTYESDVMSWLHLTNFYKPYVNNGLHLVGHIDSGHFRSIGLHVASSAKFGLKFILEPCITVYSTRNFDCFNICPLHIHLQLYLGYCCSV